MRVLDRGDQLRKELDAARAAGRRIGLVPTMAPCTTATPR